MTLSRQIMLLFVVFPLLCAGEANAQVRLSPEAAEKLLVEKTEAVYPPIAKQVRAEGLVRVQITVSDQGVVTEAKAINGHPLLQLAAVTAVKKRKYRAHQMEGKPVGFITDVYIRFPPGAVTPEQMEAHNRQVELADKFLEKDRACRSLVKEQKWQEAGDVCREAVLVGDQLGDNRSLEKMGAYEMWGFALQGQKRYLEALEAFNRALAAVAATLKETDAELGRLYGHVAITYHLSRDLSNAREWYKKAEKVYQLAHASIGAGASDEWVVETKQQYMKALKTLLEFHRRAAEDAGAAAEIEEIKKLQKTLP